MAQVREDMLEQYDEQFKAFSKALKPFFSEKQIGFILDVWKLDVQRNHSLEINQFVQSVERLFPFSVDEQHLRNAIDNELKTSSVNHALLQGADLSKQFSQIMAFIFYSVPNSQLPKYFDVVQNGFDSIDGMTEEDKASIALKLEGLSKQVTQYNTQDALEIEVFLNSDRA